MRHAAAYAGAHKDTIVLPMTTASTMMASVHAPIKAETMEARIKIRTSGLLNCLNSSRNAAACCYAFSAFSPYCWMRLSASVCWMPLAVVYSAVMSCSAVRAQ